MKVAIITGASSGIGRAVAIELHRRGWAVGVTARRREPLEELCLELGEHSGWAVTDVGDREQTARAMADLQSQLGTVDLVIANAGIGLVNPAFRSTTIHLRELFAPMYSVSSTPWNPYSTT